MRALRNAPGFTATATFTLAVSIAAVVTVYSLYSRVILSPLNVAQPESLVSLYAINPSANFVPPTLSWPRFEAIADSASAFSKVAAYSADTVGFSDPDGPAEQLAVWRISAGFFEVWGGQIAQGRAFVAEEDRPGGAAVCILTHEFWQTRFGGQDVLGRQIELNGTLTEIVGVTAPGLSAPWGGRQLFIPRVFEDSGFPPAGIQGGASYVNVVARLRDGTDSAQAVSSLQAVSAGYREAFGSNGDAANEIMVRPLVETVVGDRRSTFVSLLGASMAVLGIACANVAALFLGWRTTRQRETAVRAALGARRARLAGEVFGEALAIASLAGLLGIILAAVALVVLRSILTPYLPAGITVHLDSTAIVVGLTAVVVAMAIVGAPPAWEATRKSAPAQLATYQRSTTDSVGARRIRAALVMGETAVSVALLVAAALMLTSLFKLFSESPGFDGEQVAAGYINLPAADYDTPERLLEFHFSVQERLVGNADVTGAAIVFGLPFHDENYAHTYLPAGQPVVPPSERMRAGLRIVSEGYFQVMGMRVVAGRSFTSDDRNGAPRVCIVNESLQRRLGAGAPVIGNVLLRGRNADQPCEIVGVVADVKTNGLKQPTPDEVFYAFRQLPRRDAFHVVRTSGNPQMIGPVLRMAVSEQDARIPVARFASMSDRYAGTLGAERIMGGVIVALAIAALALAAVGLYAVLAHSVATRVSEIGVRMALGAQRGRIIRLVLGQGLRLVAAGAVIGVLGAVGVARLLSARLFGVSPFEPWIFASVVVLFLVVGALAALGPALRGSGIDPATALRN